MVKDDKSQRYIKSNMDFNEAKIFKSDIYFPHWVWLNQEIRHFRSQRLVCEVVHRNRRDRSFYRMLLNTTIKFEKFIVLWIIIK